MWFSEDVFYDFIENVLDAIYFVIDNTYSWFFSIIRSPMLSLAFFLPVGLVIVFMIWEFILWASDFKLKKNNIYGVTKKYIKSGKYKKDKALVKGLLTDKSSFTVGKGPEKPKKVYKPEVVKVPKAKKSSAKIDIEYDEG